MELIRPRKQQSMAVSLLFTGHMVDLPDRKTPRFPPALEEPVRKRIGVELDRVKGMPISLGFASGARGGDILFHEECRARGIETVVVLPFSPEEFVRTSVAGVRRGAWQKRFRGLWNETAPGRRHVLEQPISHEAYAACNSRLLELARQHGRVHLIALWDGGGADGPGGTADLVAKAKAAGDQPVVISPDDLKA